MGIWARVRQRLTKPTKHPDFTAETLRTLIFPISEIPNEYNISQVQDEWGTTAAAPAAAAPAPAATTAAPSWGGTAQDWNTA